MQPQYCPVLGSRDLENLPFKSENKIPHLKDSYELLLLLLLNVYTFFFKYSTNPSLNNSNKNKRETGFIFKINVCVLHRYFKKQLEGAGHLVCTANRLLHYNDLGRIAAQGFLFHIHRVENVNLSQDNISLKN